MSRGAGVVLVEAGGKEKCSTLPGLLHYPVVVRAREEGEKLCRHVEKRQGG